MFAIFSRNLEVPMEGSTMESKSADNVKKAPLKRAKSENTNRPTFINIHFKAIFEGLTTGAALLPSLKAQHKVCLGSAIHFKAIFEGLITGAALLPSLKDHIRLIWVLLVIYHSHKKAYIYYISECYNHKM